MIFSFAAQGKDLRNFDTIEQARSTWAISTHSSVEWAWAMFPGPNTKAGVPPMAIGGGIREIGYAPGFSFVGRPQE